MILELHKKTIEKINKRKEISPTPPPDLLTSLKINPIYKITFPPKFITLAKRIKGEMLDDWTNDIYLSIKDKRVEVTNGSVLLIEDVESRS